VNYVVLRWLVGTWAKLPTSSIFLFTSFSQLSSPSPNISMTFQPHISTLSPLTNQSPTDPNSHYCSPQYSRHSYHSHPAPLGYESNTCSSSVRSQIAPCSGIICWCRSFQKGRDRNWYANRRNHQLESRNSSLCFGGCRVVWRRRERRWRGGRGGLGGGSETLLMCLLSL
jgi:hypothetical protein